MTLVLRSTWIALALCLAAGTANAQCVDVAQGVCVTRKTYSAPANEQPFHGFADTSPAMREADAALVTQVLASGLTREQGAEQALRRGWAALQAGDFITAGHRFNQAYLLDPQGSATYHAFAALADVRFKDSAYAEELFLIARRLPRPAPTLNADYARLLLKLRRAGEALPLLEQAVKDAPTFETAWSNLALARLETGDNAGACAAAAQVGRLKPGTSVRQDLALVERQAGCPRPAP
ncbi:MAG TPA: tetratricopeptide repeat protein [Xanthobacteraceae bacterium]|nr:tetratricopeptide repeat protein [Xanthobacteraceae bacterium]